MNKEEMRDYVAEMTQRLPTIKKRRQQEFADNNIENCNRAKKLLKEKLNLQTVEIEAIRDFNIGTYDEYECIVVRVYSDITDYKRVDIPWEIIQYGMEQKKKKFEDIVFNYFFNTLLYRPKEVKTYEANKFEKLLVTYKNSNKISVLDIDDNHNIYNLYDEVVVVNMDKVTGIKFENYQAELDIKDETFTKVIISDSVIVTQ